MINFIVALPAEAKPLVQHFKLQRDTKKQKITLYGSEQFRLLVTEPGKAAARNSVNRLMAWAHNADQELWINIGIAGHPDAELGSVFLATQIKDDENDSVWKLTPPETFNYRHDSLITLAKPDFEYSRPDLLDMEAASVISALSNQVPLKNIQCLKIVSDSAQNPGHRITAQFVTSLIEQSIPTLEKLITHLIEQTANRDMYQ